MNTDQAKSLIRSGLKLGAAYLVTRGYGQYATLLNTPDAFAFIMLLASLVWSHFSHSSPAASVSSSAFGSTRGPVLSIALALLCSVTAYAQPSGIITGSNTNSVLANNIPNFFENTETWGTSFDTNKSWTPITAQFEDGLNQSTTGTGASDYIRGQYDMGRWNVTVEGDFFGVGSAFTSIEGGGGFALIQKYDFKTEINILLGIGRNPAWKFQCEVECKLTKLMTANTYATASIYLPYRSGQTFDGSPGFRGGLGFTF